MSTTRRTSRSERTKEEGLHEKSGDRSRSGSESGGKKKRSGNTSAKGSRP